MQVCLQFGRKFVAVTCVVSAPRVHPKPRVARASQVLAALVGGDTLALGARRFSKKWPRQLRRWPRPLTNVPARVRILLLASREQGPAKMPAKEPYVALPGSGHEPHRSRTPPLSMPGYVLEDVILPIAAQKICAMNFRPLKEK